MASVTERAGPGLRLPSVPLAFFGVLLLGPVLLGISRLLPEEGGGLWLRLAAASACVLFLPGALLLRAFDWPRRLGQVIAGSLAWSLVAVAVAFALTFAASGSLSLTIVVLGVVAAGGALAALRAAPARLDRRDLYPAAAVAVGGLALCGVVWWASTVVDGDALFHLARVRKLDEVPVLYSVHVVNEFRDGSLHPQYAFPLWDGVLALVGRLAGVDPSLAVLHLSAVLTPVALLMAYAAGAALFVSWAGGVAASIAAATLVGFQHDGIGAFETTALPASAAGLLIVPALLALVFGYVRGGPRSRHRDDRGRRVRAGRCLSDVRALRRAAARRLPARPVRAGSLGSRRPASDRLVPRGRARSSRPVLRLAVAYRARHGLIHSVGGRASTRSRRGRRVDHRSRRLAELLTGRDRSGRGGHHSRAALHPRCGARWSAPLGRLRARRIARRARGTARAAVLHRRRGTDLSGSGRAPRALPAPRVRARRRGDGGGAAPPRGLRRGGGARTGHGARVLERDDRASVGDLDRRCRSGRRPRCRRASSAARRPIRAASPWRSWWRSRFRLP